MRGGGPLSLRCCSLLVGCEHAGHPHLRDAGHWHLAHLGFKTPGIRFWSFWSFTVQILFLRVPTPLSHSPEYIPEYSPRASFSGLCNTLIPHLALIYVLAWLLLGNDLKL